MRKPERPLRGWALWNAKKSWVPLLERFLARVSFSESGCWLWTGAKCKGYGAISRTGTRRDMASAHIVAHELFIGPVPKCYEVDHLCRVPACVNPDHLEAVEHRENTLRGLRGKLLTHCPQGHPYNKQNTYLWHGYRHCRACRKEREYARRRALHGAVMA